SASISQRPLSLASVAVADKVYDGGTAATVTNWSLSNVVEGDQVRVSAGSGQFSTAGAGAAKPVLALANSLGGADAANYSLVAASQTGSASISQRPLSLASVAVADKAYDGNTAATVTGWTLSNAVNGDQVQVQSGSGQFSTAGAGLAKPVLALASSLAGADAGNYRLGTTASQSGSAAITPAPLRYLADPASTVSGQPLPALTGTVTGFVNGESLASATTGNLQFSTAAVPASPPGPYAVAGSGLAALNYRFSQAPGNASALTLTPAPAPSEPVSLPVNPFVTQSAVTLVLPPPEATSPASGRALDALAALRPGGSDRTEFASLDLASLSPAAVAGVLAARDEYKKITFQQALAQLELDPTLADATGCATAQQAATGQCLITAPLAGALALSNARVDDRSAALPPGTAAAPSPAAAAAPAATTAPAATAAVPPPAPTAAVRTAGAALPARPPQPVVDLPARRGVKAASLPQIQRKIALVIGIDQYSDARIPRLANAANDARAVAASLEAHLGYETVVLENANRSGIFRALNQLVEQVGPADSVVVYYAGHGERAEKSGQGYWQPADADPSRAETWISNADIDRLLRQLPASQVALISDSCYSGSLVSGERIRGATAPQDPVTLLGRRAAVVMTSGGNEPVFDSGKNGHSPFAWSLMQALQQVSSWKAGSSVFEQVRFAVARQLPQRPQYAAAPNAGHQAGADFLFEQRQLEGVVK
ncbi:MAG: caspase family protein, partial [Microbacteriaceae bacterium]|nr:caspase family protein [Burkholderiaceae bacterium]